MIQNLHGLQKSSIRALLPRGSSNLSLRELGTNDVDAYFVFPRLACDENVFFPPENHPEIYDFCNGRVVDETFLVDETSVGEPAFNEMISSRNRVSTNQLWTNPDRSLNLGLRLPIYLFGKHVLSQALLS